MWNIGSRPRQMSSLVTGGGSMAAVCSMLAMRARWLSMTPRGLPLVPDV